MSATTKTIDLFGHQMLSIGFNVDFRPPITEDDSITIYANAILIKNQGKGTAIINKNYTLECKEALPLGSQTDINMMKQKFDITFVDKSEDNRIEIITWHPDINDLC